MFLLLLAACDGSFGDIAVGVDTGAFFECDTGSETELEAGFEDALVPDGCRFRVNAVDSNAYTLLLLDVPAFARALGGEPTSETYLLPDDEVRFEVQRGCGLDLGVCESSTSEPIVMYAYEPIAGTVTVNATPDDATVLADVTFASVTLAQGSSQVAMGDTTWTGLRLYASPEE